MATDLADYAEDQIAKWVGGISTPTAVNTRKLAFWTVAPGEDGTGGTEVTGGSYARPTVTMATTGTSGVIQNSGSVTVTNMPSCTVIAVTLHDNSGNLLARKTGISKAFTAGQAAVLAAGDVTFTVT